MARQTWDEMRHARVHEILMPTELGCRWGDYPVGFAYFRSIYERDLLTEAQKPQFAAMPNYETNVAGVTVPLKVFLGKLLGSKEFEELVILSAKR